MLIRSATTLPTPHENTEPRRRFSCGSFDPITRQWWEFKTETISVEGAHHALVLRFGVSCVALAEEKQTHSCDKAVIFKLGSLWKRSSWSKNYQINYDSCIGFSRISCNIPGLLGPKKDPFSSWCHDFTVNFQHPGGSFPRFSGHWWGRRTRFWCWRFTPHGLIHRSLHSPLWSQRSALSSGCNECESYLNGTDYCQWRGWIVVVVLWKTSITSIFWFNVWCHFSPLVPKWKSFFSSFQKWHQPLLTFQRISCSKDFTSRWFLRSRSVLASLGLAYGSWVYHKSRWTLVTSKCSKSFTPTL